MIERKERRGIHKIESLIVWQMLMRLVLKLINLISLINGNKFDKWSMLYQTIPWF